MAVLEDAWDIAPMTTAIETVDVILKVIDQSAVNKDG